MDFLQLCRDAYAECGLSGSGPSATENQRDLNAQFVGWVREAWVQLQNARTDWTFMRATVEFPVLTGQQSYQLDTSPLIDGVAPDWRLPDKSFLTLQAPPSQLRRLSWVAYPDFRQRFELLPQAANEPSFLTMTPDRRLRFDCPPERDYLAKFGYRKKAQILVKPTDVPAMDEDYHAAIKWLAVMAYAAFDSAGDLYARAEFNYQRLLGRMVRYCLDEFDTSLDPIA